MKCPEEANPETESKSAAEGREEWEGLKTGIGLAFGVMTMFWN